MSSFGARFQKAIDGRAISIRAFQREISSRHIKGCSYPAIHRYLNDEATPSFAFLMAAAEVLNVRLPWLALGEGDAVQIELDEPEDLLAKRLGVERLEDVEPRIPFEALVPLNKVIARAAMYLHERDKEPQERGMVAWQLMGIIASPFESLGIEPDELPPRAYAQYVTAMVHALDLAVPFTRQDRLQA